MSGRDFGSTLDTGEPAFLEGDPGDSAYVVESGRIEIVKGIGDARVRVAVLGAGEIFGEMALLDNRPRTASAIALEPTRLTVVTREYLQERLKDSDPLLRHLVHVLSARLRTVLAPAGAAGATPRSAADEQDRQSALQRLQLSQAIEQGLDRGEFQLFLQPIVQLTDSQPVGFEALIRWQRPGQGFVSPVEFIPVAEQSELIVDIGHWVIRTACAQLAQLDRDPVAASLPPLFISVNLSARQFSDPRFFEVLESERQRHHLQAKRLKLEVTESLLIENLGAAEAMLRRCKELGFTLALDDFGAGYSSLAYLSRFPVDTLKLDRCFVQGLAGNPAMQKVVRAIAALGQTLHMQVLAEGIETPDDAALLRELGVNHAQGWNFAKAMPLADALAYLRKMTTVRAE